MDQFINETKSLMAFIKKSPSSFHAVQNAAECFLEAGLAELYEQEVWTLQPGKGYFVRRGDASVIAFVVPKAGAVRQSAFKIIAAHSDSPAFKIKENPQLLKEGHYVSLNTERYGGMLLAPWFDRPLSVAGRVMVMEAGMVVSRLVYIDRDLLMLPSLAIHMDRNANQGHTYQLQKELVPLFGDETAKDCFFDLIAEAAGCSPEQIIGTDLFLCSRSEATIWGCNHEYFSSGRLDDLMCAYAAITAFTDHVGHLAVELPQAADIPLCCIFDNEEVGSSTKQGALSDFLESTLLRIAECLGMTTQQYRAALAQSFMVSADNGHAVHPNYPEKADHTNRPYMNGGVLLKYNAGQKYTTDGVSGAIFKELCRKVGVPVQTYANNSDVAGGSTLGNLSNQQVSLNTIDIGVAQLAMHSPYETAGVKDPLYLKEAMEAFYGARIQKIGGNSYRID